MRPPPSSSDSDSASSSTFLALKDDLRAKQQALALARGKRLGLERELNNNKDDDNKGINKLDSPSLKADSKADAVAAALAATVSAGTAVVGRQEKVEGQEGGEGRTEEEEEGLEDLVAAEAKAKVSVEEGLRLVKEAEEAQEDITFGLFPRHSWQVTESLFMVVVVV